MKLNNTFYRAASALLAFVSVLSSCQQEDFGYTSQDVICGKYDRDFIEFFGQPALDHQWGFSETAFIDITRATNDAPVIVGDDSFIFKRIMCEDLGGVKSDFDFNDVVYDVIYSNDLCFIVVQAVGGTLPIKLSYNSVEITGDLHSEMGAESNQPVNVQAGTKGKETSTPLILALGFNGRSGSASIGGNAIEIQTMANESAFDIKKIHLLVNNSQSTWLDVNYQTNTTPLCFCVPTSVCWLQEGKRIDAGYNKFSDWVADETQIFWDTPSDASVLCPSATTPVPDQSYSNPEEPNLAPKR